MIKNNLFTTVSAIIIGFYIIYTPEIFLAMGIPIRSQIIISVMAFFVTFKFLIDKLSQPEISWTISKKMTKLFCGIFLSSLYFSIVSLLNNFDPRIFQNLYIIVHAIVLLSWISFLHKRRYSKIKIIDLLLTISLLQAILCIVMIIIPSFKEVALNLYYLGREENVFISAMRIYGISGEYTFFTPIYHGILCVLAFNLSTLVNWKYFIFIPFYLIAIIFNGRTGIVIFVVGTIISFILTSILKKRKVFRMFLIIFLSAFIIYFGIMITKYVSMATYKWLMTFVESTFSLLREKESQDTYSVLSSMLFFPDTIRETVFGVGSRVYANQLSIYGYAGSDIGYVNDIFMGGLVYVLMQYGTVFLYLKPELNLLKNNDNKNIDTILNIVMSMSMLVILLVANYKGEVMRSGLVLLGVIVIKYILNLTDLKELEKNDISNNGSL